MFCKVCKDSGMPEPTYTSHFVKDHGKFWETLELKENAIKRELHFIKQRQEELKQQIARPFVNLFVTESEDKEALEVKKVSPSFVLDTSHLKGKSWTLDDSDDSDED